jgi:hypothetical protein
LQFELINGTEFNRSRLSFKQMAPAATNNLNDAHRAGGQGGSGAEGNASAGAAPSIPIAIVGMACRFGGDVTNPSKLWELCVSGRDGWTPIPEDRFDVKGLYHKDHTRVGRSHIIGGYFLKEDISLFDAAFFNLSSDVANVSPYGPDEPTKAEEGLTRMDD